MSVASDLNFRGGRRLPVVHSAEIAECGLACLAMIAIYYGHQTDLNALRQRFAGSLSGLSLKHLMKLADELHLAARPLRVELPALKKISLPAIIHWGFNHYVVLRSMNHRGAVIHDPVRGAVRLSTDELSKQFTGVVLELAPTAAFRPVNDRLSVRLNSLWSQTSGLTKALIQVFLLSAFTQLLAFALPFQLQLVVDEAILRDDRSLLLVIVGGFAIVVLVQAAVEATRGWALQTLGYSAIYQVMGNVVRHLIRLPSSFFEKRHVGDILSRLSSAKSIQDILTKGILTAVIDGIMATIGLVVLIVYSGTLTSIVLGSLILKLVVLRIAYPVLKSRTEQSIAASAKEQSHMMESIRAASTIKLMGREIEREAGWRNLYAEAINTSFSVERARIWLKLFQTAVSGLQLSLVLYFGATMVMDADGFSIGMLIAFISFQQTFTDRANALIEQLVQIKFVGLHLDRLSDIVTVTPERNDALVYHPHEGGSIEMRKVDFRYGELGKPVLCGLDLKIEAGQYIAIRGPSGGGKSTLVKLLLGLQEPTSGAILLDGEAATAARWRKWREHVGVVSQDDRLLTGSIGDNIGFFDPDLDMERVVAAAKAARVHNDIVTMPMQYMSPVGDMGSTLSGGQKQRVLLARALYRDPRVLVLDEGTANLDEDNEEAIADLVEGLDITRIVIAHRPALLRRAHRVLTLLNGHLLEVDGDGIAHGGLASTLSA